MEPEVVITPERPRRRPTFSMMFIRFIRRYGLWLVLFLLILAAAASFELGRYTVYKEHPGLSSQDQATQILAKVGQLIQLPANETPTMATITNAAAVKKTQPFLAHAQNGDVLIIYATAQTALVYRPSTNKLIAVGPVTSQPTTQSPTQETPIPVTPAKTTTSSTTKSSTNASSSTSTK